MATKNAEAPDFFAQLCSDAESFLCCPECHSTGLQPESNEKLRCVKCGANYAVSRDNQLACLLNPKDLGETKESIQQWWGDLCKQLYEEFDNNIDTIDWAQQLKDLEDLFVCTDHMAGTELSLNGLQGKRILEIGSGSGAHSALFKHYGGDVVSVDITPERVRSTAIKLAHTKNGIGRAYQADAENLPFADESFDIVYSNGVLHHSDDTERCIAEVYRVLKPNGQAAIMLYAKHSLNVYLNIIPRGILTGFIFRYPQDVWMGLVTEGKPKHGDQRNPRTRVYSKRALFDLFHKFTNVTPRRAGWEWDQMAVPRLTQFREKVMHLFGIPYHPGALPVAGKARIPPSRFERFVSRYLGFNWNIKATKQEKHHFDSE